MVTDNELFSIGLTLIALIVGLPIARLLGTVALLVEYRGQLRNTSLLYPWLVVLTLQQTQWWWGLWMYRNLGENVLQAMVAYSEPVFACLAIYTICPTAEQLRGHGSVVDVGEHYRRTYRPFFLFAAAAIAMTVVDRLCLPLRWEETFDPTDSTNLFRYAAVALLAAMAFVPLAFPRRKAESPIGWVHRAAPWAALALIVGFLLTIDQSADGLIIRDE